MKITHYLAGFILGANLVIVGNSGWVSAGQERQACLSCLSHVDGHSTQAFVYNATISPDRKLLQVVIGCNSLIGSFSDTFLGLKFQCPTTSLFHSCFHVPQPHFSIAASASNWLTVWRHMLHTLPFLSLCQPVITVYAALYVAREFRVE